MFVNDTIFLLLGIKLLFCSRGVLVVVVVVVLFDEARKVGFYAPS